jgi:hypothetical protein
LSEVAILEKGSHQPVRTRRDDDRVRFSKGLEAGCQVRCLANRRVLLRDTFADQVTDDDDTRGDTDTGLKVHVGSGVQRADRVEDGEAGTHGPFCVIFVGCRVAEISQYAVAQVLRDHTTEVIDLVGTARLKAADDVALPSGSRSVESALDPTMSQNMIVSCRRSAATVGRLDFAADGGATCDLSRLRLAPHSVQNLACTRLACPQELHARGSALPHCWQNLLPSGTITLQAGHCIAGAPG